MRRMVLLGLAGLLLALVPTGCERRAASWDVVVLGGTPSGVTAAVAAARQGRRACLIVEQKHVGGMLASGLGCTDTGKPELVGGLAREVFYAIYGHYHDAYGEGSRQEQDCAGGLHFEPHVAETVFESILNEAGVDVLLGQIFLYADLENKKIKSLRVRDNASGAERDIAGVMFIDASYAGDLFADAGATFRLGREPRVSFGESLAGRIYQKPLTSELLPGSSGEGDSLIQAYNYRLCLTDSLENQATWPEPSQYDPLHYRELYDYMRRTGAQGVNDFMLFSPLPNRKYDVNNYGYCRVSTDLIGGSTAYPQAEPEERSQIERAHMDHILGLFKFLRTDSGVPGAVREQFSRYAPAVDEFTDNGHLPFQIYVREARRLIGVATFSQSDALTDTLKTESVGMGGCNLESHAVGGWDHDYPWAEGFFSLESRPYQIPYRIMISSWVRNLVVPVAVSSTHVVCGSLRTEAVSMELGQAAGVAAALCLKYNCEVDETPLPELQSILRSEGAILSQAEARPWDPAGGSRR